VRDDGRPWLPPGGPLDLPGRGRTYVRHHRARGDQPTVVLLHGMGVTADVNWFGAYGKLAERYGVLAIDHRGHGRGLRSERRFRLADCADDAVAAMDVFGIDRAVMVGYSMGGPIAQLVWHRHRERVAGLVLCATTHSFRGLEPARGFGPALVQRARSAAGGRRGGRLDDDLRRWLTREVSRTSRRSAVQAGFALSRYDSSAWLGEVDVPHAVVITERDSAVTPIRQRRMAAKLPNPSIHLAPTDHAGVVTRPSRFVPVLLEAIDAVATPTLARH
jgi:3-oxoadipate enol-lactonase